MPSLYHTCFIKVVTAGILCRDKQYVPALATKHLTALGRRSDENTRESEVITLTLADDHVIVRDLMRYLLEAAGDIRILAMASNGQEAVDHAVLHSPQVAVLDISMPVMDGIEATALIRDRCPQTHVLMLSMYQTSEYIHRCIQAGAMGYILKDMAGEDLVKAVHSLSQGKRYFSKQILEIIDLFR